MSKTSLAVVVACALAQAAVAQSPAWGQCGGQGWAGSTTCVSGWVCTYSNPFYSQCLQGTGTPSSTPATTTTRTTTSQSSTGGGTPTSTTSASGTTPTLVAGYSFIRAVEDPNFHKYLQSEVLNTASDAVLGEPVNAAQFQITNGQLIQNALGTSLYAIVEPRANSTVNKLKVSWSKTAASSGTFVWSGDTVEWSNPSITRPQNNAWLVCPDANGHKDLYVNLGAYSYMTPAGCADETIHAYTGSTPTA
ncbi:hypothetical protein D9619_009788 [Psilocybe cf. subviscida]|uniref:CBM1 domain-containing protein n=1 Tax=Psilocybe cf. subviscida TaxID=2480587 RepID=A0A8H5F675_9AGAR|nr:hypothetical protein D9619_009788 [Psilocybe cf. subviscida]